MGTRGAYGFRLDGKGLELVCVDCNQLLQEYAIQGKEY